jgi:two-component system, LuxR family, sensor kinase FixL
MKISLPAVRRPVPAADSLRVERKLLLAVAYVGAYVLLSWLCYVRPVFSPGITPWHPQAGLTLAFLIVIGPAWCLATAIAALLAAFLLAPLGLSPVAVIAGALWSAFVYGLLAHILRQFFRLRSVRTVADAVRLSGAAGVMTLAVASGFVAAYVLNHDMEMAEALRAITRYWLADLIGILMLTPLLLTTGATPATLRAWRTRRWEIFWQLAAVAALLCLILSLPVADQLRLLYLLFVPLIWIALRWGWEGALPAVLAIQLVLIFAAENAMHTPRFIDLQFLMLTLSLTALLLGAVVAERRRSELELRERDAALGRAMRFAIAGELASALAHQLSQPITALVSYINAAQILSSSAAAETDRLHATLGKAAQQAIRASEVLQRLRNLYIAGRARREAIDVAQLCADVAAGFEERLRVVGARVEVLAAADLPVVEGDRTQIEIALHNLVGNAVDALEPRVLAGGRVQVQAERQGQAIMISVEDSGPGVAPQVADTLFEPFVSTKADGMGLGLAISRSIVRLRGGDITASRAESLGGARFSILIPIALPDASWT